MLPKVFREMFKKKDEALKEVKKTEMILVGLNHVVNEWRHLGQDVGEHWDILMKEQHEKLEELKKMAGIE